MSWIFLTCLYISNVLRAVIMEYWRVFCKEGVTTLSKMMNIKLTQGMLPLSDTETQLLGFMKCLLLKSYYQACWTWFGRPDSWWRMAIKATLGCKVRSGKCQWYCWFCLALLCQLHCLECLHKDNSHAYPTLWWGCQHGFCTPYLDIPEGCVLFGN